MPLPTSPWSRRFIGAGRRGRRDLGDDLLLVGRELEIEKLPYAAVDLVADRYPRRAAGAADVLAPDGHSGLEDEKLVVLEAPRSAAAQRLVVLGEVEVAQGDAMPGSSRFSMSARVEELFDSGQIPVEAVGDDAPEAAVGEPLGEGIHGDDPAWSTPSPLVAFAGEDLELGGDDLPVVLVAGHLAPDEELLSRLAESCRPCSAG